MRHTPLHEANSNRQRLFDMLTSKAVGKATQVTRESQRWDVGPFNEHVQRLTDRRKQRGGGVQLCGRPSSRTEHETGTSERCLGVSYSNLGENHRERQLVCDSYEKRLESGHE